MKRFLVGIAAVMAFGSASAQLDNTNLVLCGASPGGMWSNIGVGVDTAIKASYPSAAATYQTSSGGPANVVQVKRKTCDIGLANDGDLAAAVNGQAPFKDKVEGLQAIGVMLDWLPVMWVARKDFADKYGITSLQDLVDKKVPARFVMNRRGLLTSDITTSLLESLDMSIDQLKKNGGTIQYQASGEQANLMRDGRVDIMGNTLFEGDRGVMETAMSVDLVLLDAPESANQAVIDQYYLKPWVIKAGAFPWHEHDVNTVTTSVIMFADEDMSEQRAYDIAKAMIDNATKFAGVSKSLDKFKAAVLTQQDVLPFHPGALKAYKEAGLL